MRNCKQHHTATVQYMTRSTKSTTQANYQKGPTQYTEVLILTPQDSIHTSHYDNTKLNPGLLTSDFAGN